jgi:hypothetical protein
MLATAVHFLQFVTNIGQLIVSEFVSHLHFVNYINDFMALKFEDEDVKQCPKADPNCLGLIKLG